MSTNGLDEFCSRSGQGKAEEQQGGKDVAENKQTDFLETVRQQIKWGAAWPGISAELADHLAEHEAQLLAEGVAVEEAEAQAVQAMGDAAEIGRSLDELHRPQLAKGLLALSAVLMVFSLGSMVYAQAQGYPLLLWRTLLGAAGGMLLAVLLYFADYSKWLRGSAVFYAVGLALPVGVSLLGGAVNGRRIYLSLGSFRVNCYSLSALLFVAAVVGFLVLWQNKGLRGLLCCGALAALSVAVVLQGEANLAVVMAFWYVALFTLVIHWGYFGRRRGLNYGVVYGAVALVWLGIAAFLLTKPSWLARITGFMHPVENMYGGDWGYASTILTLRQAQWIGPADLSGILSDMSHTYPAVLVEPMTNYAFMRLINDFGLLAGVLAAGGLLLLLYEGWRKMRQVKNHYGQLMGLSALALLGGQSFCHILMNLGLYPATGVSLPFFSTGGTNMLVSWLLLGVILAIWRRNTILLESEPPSENIVKQGEGIVQWSQGRLIIDFGRLFSERHVAKQLREGGNRGGY